MHSEDNFDVWNKKKQTIHNTIMDNIYVNQGEIRYAYIGINIGSEACGKGQSFTRPVLVMKKLGALFLVLPMTTKGKDNNHFYHKIDDKYFGCKSYLQLTQVKVLDKRRFSKHIGTLSKNDFALLKEKLRDYYL